MTRPPVESSSTLQFLPPFRRFYFTSEEIISRRFDPSYNLRFDCQRDFVSEVVCRFSTELISLF